MINNTKLPFEPYHSIGLGDIFTMPLLEVENVVSGYGRTDVLHGVSISVERDEIVTIIGPNGAGKSTLFKTIMGYLIPRSGKVVFSEEDVTQLKPNQKVEKALPMSRSLTIRFLR